jgi:hypothetical protein
MSLSENGYFGFMLRQAFQKNPHILRVCSGFFEKLSLPKTKISHFRTGSITVASQDIWIF